MSLCRASGTRGMAVNHENVNYLMTLSRRNLIIAAGLLMFGGLGTVDAFGGYPENYYNSLNGKCGAALMDAIKKMAAGHKEISYGDATWRAFRSTDIKVVNGKEYWWDMYSNNLVSTNGHSGMNIEHSVANSWWDGTENAAYKDIVHLNPSDKTANNRKSNYPLGVVSGTPTWENGVTFVGHPTSNTGGGSNYVYEPADEYKGDFARVFMYMFCAYKDMKWGTRFTWMYDTGNELMFKPWAQELLLSWSNLDAVSQKERDRNDGIQKEQGNRNPFIDLPDLADHIWGDKKNVPYNTGTGGGDDPDDPKDPTDQNVFNWLGEDDPNGGAGWDFDIVSMDPALSYVWQWKSYTDKNKPTKYYMNGSAYMDGAPYAAEAYVWGPEVDMTDVEAATFSFDHAAKFQTTLKDLCKVAVMDMNVNANEAGHIKTFEVPSWPVADRWAFSSSGDIDLSEYGKTGSKIRVGFKYQSNTSGADTWEVRNAKLTLTRKQGSGIEDVPAADGDNDDSVLVEVWGNNILAPEGAMIFDLNGRQCSGENLARGIYIVTKPTFRKAVKVMVK